MSKSKYKIGFSACFSHPDRERPIHRNKTLLYLEESIAHWLMSHRAMPFLIPSTGGALSLSELVDEFDGLVLQGGVDVSPTTYGETPLKPEWSGDAKRDKYEIALVNEMMNQGKPILGICRGEQLINVAMGGTLYQDIRTQNDKAIVHRDGEVYDQLFHDIRFEKGSLLEKIYGSAQPSFKVNSVHHQAIKDLGTGLQIEARAMDDQVIEAVRYDSEEQFVFGVQWHPEYQDPNNKTLLDPAPLLSYFLQQVEKRQSKG